MASAMQCQQCAGRPVVAGQRGLSTAKTSTAALLMGRPAGLVAPTGRRGTMPVLAQATATSATPAVKEDALQRFLKDPDTAEQLYLTGRANQIRSHFPTALSVDDFINRLEIALYAYGFTGDNAIAMTNLCRDEITLTVKNRIDSVFGSSFNTNGLGGVLTCGVTGVKAGLSHSPICASSGKERYVFFSMPHIAIDSAGDIGAISRPGRPGPSCACGALFFSMKAISEQGIMEHAKAPGVHDYDDPELSILKQRLARRMRFENWDEAKVKGMNLVDITKLAERTISDDLEYLIQRAVDPTKADYAVITAVQIHNYGKEFDDASPNLEFVAPTGVYVCINGEKTYIDLEAVPSLTPRQTALLADAQTSKQTATGEHIVNSAGTTTARSIDTPYLYSTTTELKAKETRAKSYAELLAHEKVQAANKSTWPSWRSNITADAPNRQAGDNSTELDMIQNATVDLDALTKQFVNQLRTVASQKVFEDMKRAKDSSSE